MSIQRAAYIAEAGYGEALWRLSQNTDCGGYADIASTAFGAGTYDVGITPASGSPVTAYARARLPPHGSRYLQIPHLPWKRS